MKVATVFVTAALAIGALGACSRPDTVTVDTATPSPSGSTVGSAGSIPASPPATETPAPRGTVPIATTPDQGTMPPANGGSVVTISAARASFIKKGNAICAVANPKLKVAFARDYTTNPELGAKLDAIVQLYLDELAQLTALAPPPEDAAAIADFLALDQQMIDDLQQSAIAAHRNDYQGVIDLQGPTSDAVDKLNAAFNAYGLTTCGES